MPTSSRDFESETFTDHSFDAASDMQYKTFLDCAFVNCTFLETDMTGSTFRDCTFNGCALGPARIRSASFEGVDFIDCKVIGLNWTEAQWSKKAAYALSFLRCRVGFFSFAHLPLRGLSLTECSADEIDFTGTDLSSADLRDSEFRGCRFNTTVLAKADLRGARNYVINPAKNSVAGMKVSMPEAMGLLAGLGIEIE